MADERSSNDLPRVEPEIIPPGRDGAGRGPDQAWGNTYGTHRVYFIRPGLPSILIGLVIFSIIAAAIFLVLAGVVLLLPLLIGGVALAILFSVLRSRLRGWLRQRP